MYNKVVFFNVSLFILKTVYFYVFIILNPHAIFKIHTDTCLENDSFQSATFPSKFLSWCRNALLLKNVFSVKYASFHKVNYKNVANDSQISA